jgi:hypothetical protein
MDTRRQVEDYALDLQDFHAGSSRHPIIPVAIGTIAKPRSPQWPLCWHGVTEVFEANGDSLKFLLKEVTKRIPSASSPLKPSTWDAAAYRPVPTIVDAPMLAI